MTTASFTAAKAESLTGIVAGADPELCGRVLQLMKSAQWQADEARGGADALDLLESGGHQALVLCSELEDLNPSEFVEIVKERHPHVDIVWMDSSASQLLSSPSRIPPARTRELLDLLQNSAQIGVAPKPIQAALDLTAPNPEPSVASLAGVIGNSPKMAQVYRLARLVAPRNTTVLVMGDTGTGKELVARGIHDLSPRARKPFVVVNCAAIPDTLLEAELFGYERGAFTGAVQSRMGRIQMARGGTLFLDEVGELPLSMQAKLLRFLQEGEVQRLGSSDVGRVDARVIAATNLNLLQHVATGQFRRDLYYRLAVFPIEVPPLRERGGDILLLAEYFIRLLARQAGQPPSRLPAAARRALQAYGWPGNVRELQHLMERTYILSEGQPELFPCTKCELAPRPRNPSPCPPDADPCMLGSSCPLNDSGLEES